MRKEENLYENLKRQLPEFTCKLKNTIHVPTDHPMYSTYLNDALWKFDRGHEVAKRLDTEICHLNGKLVLDIGAGTGGIASGFRSFGAHVISADVAKGFMNLARTAYNELNLEVDCIYSSGECIPIQDNKVDIAIAYNIFEHVVNLKMLIKEIVRVLKPNGMVLIRADYRFDITNIKRDPYYGLPLVIVLPRFFRKIVVCNIFKRSADLDDYYWIKNYNEIRKNFKKYGMKTRLFYDDIIADKHERGE